MTLSTATPPSKRTGSQALRRWGPFITDIPSLGRKARAEAHIAGQRAAELDFESRNTEHFEMGIAALSLFFQQQRDDLVAKNQTAQDSRTKELTSLHGDLAHLGAELAERPNRLTRTLLEADDVVATAKEQLRTVGEPVMREFDAATYEKIAYMKLNAGAKVPARFSSRPYMLYATIYSLAVLETGINGVFFREASPDGLVGSILEWSLMAPLNVLFAFLFGIGAWRLCAHRERSMRLAGIVFGATLLSLIALVNLLIAGARLSLHFGLTGNLMQVATIVQDRSLVRHLDLQTIALFFFGLAAAGFAAFKAMQMYDRHIGWTPVYRRWQAAEKAVNALSQSFSSYLTNVKSDFEKELNDSVASIAKQMNRMEDICNDLQSGRDSFDVTQTALRDEFLGAASEFRAAYFSHPSHRALLRPTPPPPTWVSLPELPIQLDDARRVAGDTLKVARAVNQAVASELMAHIQAERRGISDILDEIRVESRMKRGPVSEGVPHGDR